MLFTFKRDYEGRETIEVGGLAIARPTNVPENFEWLHSMPGITAEHVREAVIKADEAGFWERDECGIPQGPSEATVDVPVAETTSTILTIDNTEDQA